MLPELTAVTSPVCISRVTYVPPDRVTNVPCSAPASPAPPSRNPPPGPPPPPGPCEVLESDPPECATATPPIASTAAAGGPGDPGGFSGAPLGWSWSGGR